jgi:prepilin-type N-terminal cleavage/methylation domain-containing protein
MKKHQAGFTLLEVLLVVGIITVLAAIVIVAINPSKQLGDAKNAQRRSDVNTILNAVYQYKIDNNGSDPGTLVATDVAGAEIWSGSGSSVGLTDLSNLTLSGRYLVSVPKDPTAVDPNTKYRIWKNATSSRITVKAQSPDNSATISVEK